jgi:hypothetical protein
MGQYTDRQVQGFQLGPVIGTILYVPVNFSALIYSFRYVTGGVAGTVAATIVAEMRASTQGTITGTVDTVMLVPGTPMERDSLGEAPLARVEGGQNLVGVVVFPTGAAGSIEGVLEYEYVPGRLAGA